MGTWRRWPRSPPNDPTFQPGFEDADTTVQAAVPYYGVYDFTDADNMHEMMLPFLEQFVMKARYADEPERFKAASPISYVHSEAPPFFVLHGEKDELVPSGQARAFCAALRDAGAPTVSYAELANAHHAFDITPDGPIAAGRQRRRRLPGDRLRAARKLAYGFVAAVGDVGQLKPADSTTCHDVSCARSRQLSWRPNRAFHQRVNPTSVVCGNWVGEAEAGGLISGDTVGASR